MRKLVVVIISLIFLSICTAAQSQDKLIRKLEKIQCCSSNTMNRIRKVLCHYSDSEIFAVSANCSAKVLMFISDWYFLEKSEYLIRLAISKINDTSIVYFMDQTGVFNDSCSTYLNDYLALNLSNLYSNDSDYFYNNKISAIFLDSLILFKKNFFTVERKWYLLENGLYYSRSELYHQRLKEISESEEIPEAFCSLAKFQDERDTLFFMNYFEKYLFDPNLFTSQEFVKINSRQLCIIYKSIFNFPNSLFAFILKNHLQLYENNNSNIKYFIKCKKLFYDAYEFY